MSYQISIPKWPKPDVIVEAIDNMKLEGVKIETLESLIRLWPE